MGTMVKNRLLGQVQPVSDLCKLSEISANSQKSLQILRNLCKLCQISRNLAPMAKVSILYSINRGCISAVKCCRFFEKSERSQQTRLALVTCPSTAKFDAL